MRACGFGGIARVNDGWGGLIIIMDCVFSRCQYNKFIFRWIFVLYLVRLQHAPKIKIGGFSYDILRLLRIIPGFFPTEIFSTSFLVLDLYQFALLFTD